jgi:hypothetical protein
MSNNIKEKAAETGASPGLGLTTRQKHPSRLITVMKVLMAFRADRVLWSYRGN